MEQQGLQGVHAEPAEGANEQRVIGKTRQGKTLTIEVDAHGSSTGFAPCTKPAPTSPPPPARSKTANWWTSNPWAT